MGTTTIEWFDNQTVVWFGWAGFMFGQYGWYANVPFCFALIYLLLGKVPRSDGLPAAQLVLVACAFVPAPLAHNEGYSEPVCAFGPGFWLWILAQAIVALTVIFGRRARSLA
jgi:hypothetical protein